MWYTNLLHALTSTGTTPASTKPKPFWPSARPTRSCTGLISSPYVLDRAQNPADLFSKVFEKQTTWYNQPSASVTPSQIRDQLVELAIPLIKSEGPQSATFGKLREALEVRSSPNGGNETTLGLKHGSEWIGPARA